MNRKNTEKETQTISEISSSPFARSASLLGMTMKGGAKFAGLKIKNMFRDEKEKEANTYTFLSSQAEVLINELGKLKGSIMKAGQMLSIYGEHLFPEEINSILKKLQSDSLRLDWSQIEKVLVQQLGKDLLSKLEIDKSPIAAASMGQVYQAKAQGIPDLLAIKVQYPGVDKAIDSDLAALRRILSVANIIPKSQSFEDIFKEVRMMLHYEADYSRELAMNLKFQELLKHDPRYVIPRVFEEFSTKRVLTMSFEDGLAVDSQEIKSLCQVRRNEICNSIMELTFNEIFSWKLVQTDPHFGNFKIRLNENKMNEQYQDQIVLFDFGAVRKFTKTYIQNFAQLVHTALNVDYDAIVAAGRQLGFLYESDAEKVNALFVEICSIAIEGFLEEYASKDLNHKLSDDNHYHWDQANLIERFSYLAKDAVFAFKFRPPPREAIFLDRKMMGLYTFLTAFKYDLGPRSMLMDKIKNCLSEK